MSRVVRRHAGIYDDLSVFVMTDLGIADGVLLEYLPTAFEFFGVGLLRAVTRDLRSRLVAFPASWKENDRGQQIISAKRRDQFVRRDLRRSCIHRTI